ncbi:hypothetical protein FRB91_006727 [Serendipita sp. 411]|nr:hypothetical protein FRB91_006727 [Serendipita sp. 411]
MVNSHVIAGGYATYIHNVLFIPFLVLTVYGALLCHIIPRRIYSSTLEVSAFKLSGSTSSTTFPLGPSLTSTPRWRNCQLYIVFQQNSGMKYSPISSKPGFCLVVAITSTTISSSSRMDINLARNIVDSRVIDENWELSVVTGRQLRTISLSTWSSQTSGRVPRYRRSVSISHRELRSLTGAYVRNILSSFV